MMIIKDDAMTIINYMSWSVMHEHVEQVSQLTQTFPWQS